MRAISTFIVRVCDLLEAEGRSLRSAVREEARDAREHGKRLAAGLGTGLVTGLAILLIGVPLVVGGTALMAAGLLSWLETQMTRSLALGTTGLAVLVLGGLCLGLLGLASGRREP